MTLTDYVQLSSDILIPTNHKRGVRYNILACIRNIVDQALALHLCISQFAEPWYATESRDLKPCGCSPPIKPISIVERWCFSNNQALRRENSPLQFSVHNLYHLSVDVDGRTMIKASVPDSDQAYTHWYNATFGESEHGTSEET